MRIGYARVARIDPDPGPQIRALERARCERVYTDRASGARERRVELDRALDALRAGDVLVVWRLDRPGRSLRHLLRLVAALDSRGVALRSISEGIDTTKPGGRFVFAFVAAVAEFERAIDIERTKLAIEAKRARGQRWGRPSKFEDPAFVDTARALLRDESLTRPQVAKTLGIDVSTLYSRFPGGDPDRFVPGRNVRRARQ